MEMLMLVMLVMPMVMVSERSMVRADEDEVEEEDEGTVEEEEGGETKKKKKSGEIYDQLYTDAHRRVLQKERIRELVDSQELDRIALNRLNLHNAINENFMNFVFYSMVVNG